MEFTIDTLKRENGDKRMLIAVHGVVYDCTSFSKKHPGGQKILQMVSGTDATDTFEAFHPEHGQSTKIRHFILSMPVVGRLQGSAQTELRKDFEKVKVDFLSTGMYRPSTSFFLRMNLFLFVLFGLAVYHVKMAQSLFDVIISSLLVALFYQQAAFLGHDLCHSSALQTTRLNAVCAVFWGPLMTGIGVSWWRFSHNMHHTCVNEVERDPDIQHLPVFSLSKFAITQGGFFSTYHTRFMAYDSIAKFFVTRQHIFFFPVICVARYNLYFQSLLFSTQKFNTAPTAHDAAEIACMLLHHLAFLRVASVCASTVWHGVLLYVLANAFSGILNLQIVSSHFSNTVSEPSERKDDVNAKDLDCLFLRQQVDSTTDIQTSPYTAWFFGGLEHQTVHHVFPRIPRHKLKDASVVLELLCQKHGVKFHRTGFASAVRRVLVVLRALALQARCCGTKVAASELMSDTFHCRG